jgi:hypothetical protein
MGIYVLLQRRMFVRKQESRYGFAMQVSTGGLLGYWSCEQLCSEQLSQLLRSLEVHATCFGFTEQLVMQRVWSQSIEPAQGWLKRLRHVRQLAEEGQDGSMKHTR